MNAARDWRIRIVFPSGRDAFEAALEERRRFPGWMRQVGRELCEKRARTLRAGLSASVLVRIENVVTGETFAVPLGPAEPLEKIPWGA